MIPKNKPVPIGEFIEEDILKEFQLTQGQLAQALNVSRKTINDLVNNRRSLTADMALRLATFTKTTPQLWLGLQNKIDLWNATHSKNPNGIDTILPYAA